MYSQRELTHIAACMAPLANTFHKWTSDELLKPKYKLEKVTLRLFVGEICMYIPKKYEAVQFLHTNQTTFNECYCIVSYARVYMLHSSTPIAMYIEYILVYIHV